MKLTRRKFLAYTSGAAGLAIASTAVASTANTTGLINTTKLQIPIKHHHGSAIRVAFLSDIHLGPFLEKSMLDEAIKIVKEHSPDLLILGGDYLWLPDSSLSNMFRSCIRNFQGVSYRDLPSAIFEQFADATRELKLPHGIYAVYGNHDRWVNPYLCKKTFEKAGIKLLINDLVELNVRGSSLKLFGTDDYWTGVPKPPPFPASSTRDDIRVVISHNPDYQSELLGKSALSYDFGLGGHTHGGQLCLPLYGALFYNINDQRFRSGLTTVRNTSVFTSRGIGTVEIPYRVNCPAEVAIIDFVSA